MVFRKLRALDDLWFVKTLRASTKATIQRGLRFVDVGGEFTVEVNPVWCIQSTVTMGYVRECRYLVPSGFQVRE